MLQRSANPHHDNFMGTSMGHASDEYHHPAPAKSRPDILIHPSSGYASPSSSDSDTTGERDRERAEEADRREEAWVENIRVIEALRRLISERLERQEYELDSPMSGTAEHPQQAAGAQSLYPVLRADD
jgi:hypothetical protein